MVEKSFTIFYKYNKGCSDLGPLSRFCCLAFISFSVLRMPLASTLLLYNYSEKISNLHKQFRTYIYMFYATNVLVTISSTMVNRHFSNAITRQQQFNNVMFVILLLKSTLFLHNIVFCYSMLLRCTICFNTELRFNTSCVSQIPIMHCKQLSVIFYHVLASGCLWCYGYKKTSGRGWAHRVQSSY